MRKMLCVGVVSLEVIASGAVIGQEAVQPPATSKEVAAPQAPTAKKESTVETVTITATKREQVLQDVPISVSVTSAATLERAHIVDLIDLQSVVPSLKVPQFNAVGQTNFIIRGFGNGAGNDGIESSVGVFVDGVYRSRAAAALDDLPEVSRIEVLRGPQSTLFGKNVSAGAISIVTAKPQFVFGGAASIDIGNYNQLSERFTITGPISDTLAYRFSASNNKRAGYLTNETTGNKVNDRDRQSVRADLLWKPDSEVSVRVIGDYNQINETCCGAVSIYNGLATQFIGAPPPFGLGRPVSDPNRKFDETIVFNTDPTNHLVGKGISAQVDWNTSVGSLTSITAYRNQSNQSTQDVDFTGADLANKKQGNDISTFSQELRLASTGSGPLSWLVGGYYQQEKLKTGVDTSYGREIRPYANGLSGPSMAVPGISNNLSLLEYLQHAVTPGLVPLGTYFQPGQGISDHYEMEQKSYSIFGSLDYAATERLTLTGGLAYLGDRKSATSNVVLSDPFSSLNLQNVPQLPFAGVPASAFAGLSPLQFFYGNTSNHAPVNYPNANESGALSGDKLTGALRAAYDFGSAMGYVSYSTGWKAGAYNLSSDSRPPDANGQGRTASPEEVTAYEAGLKTSFQGGYLNAALFLQTIKGFQSNLYTGTGYSLVNAGKQSTRGLELDGAYQPISWMALSGALTYLDPKYDSFTQAACVSYDTVKCPMNPTTGLIPNYRDLSGTRPAGISKWSAYVAATFTQNFDNGFSSYLRAQYDYTSPVQLADNTPPELSTYGQQSLSGSLGLINKQHGYEVVLWGRNLTDHRSMIGTFPTVAQAGSYSGFANQPRTFGTTLRVRF